MQNNEKCNYYKMELKKTNPILSMTGFGRATSEYKGKQFNVELRSLNSKGLDLNLRMPPLYREKEPEVRALLSEKLIRGKIDFTLLVEMSSTETKTHINKENFISYYNQLKEIYSQIGESISDEAIASITRFPDVLETKSEDLEIDEWEIISSTIDKSVEEFIAFRQTEGESLRNDLISKAKNISALKEKVLPFEAQRKEIVRERLLKAMSELEEPLKFDPNRFEQELIYYIEKFDINEEKVRLEQHLDYFISTLKSGGNIGRKLGFIAQEIGREINTLSSKANHVEIQQLAVLMKDELEQIKEQVLNIL
ncbi:MAG TPA: YicC family protein [Salinivirgaceae bacterium]|nr:YicC family protein [Salinivirgaceae bacterium]